MSQILVRDLPEAVLKRLKSRAKANCRSMASEIRTTLADAVKPQLPRKWPTLTSMVGSAGPWTRTESINDYVRSLRDEWTVRE
jgi:plasmid stability protein